MERYPQLVNDIFVILSDEFTLKYIPEKRIRNVVEADAFLRTMILNDFTERNYLHFVTDRQSGHVIGMIDMITPEVAKEHYSMERYPYFIEFYLTKTASGHSIISQALPYIITAMIDNGINDIAAVINRNNIAARRVLEKADFKYAFKFDFQKDLYNHFVERKN